ncbi:zeta toxin family protein [Sphingobacterium sp. UBA1498]|uniref:zeta toxin family protein n=1 Tax=Sphingobacterium sp. UBA1498 TaxID=1947481 RepID=UPI0025F4A04B|nr:zeta toxin family protein [Sphingobacterium sp. UBA1498]
MKNKADFAFETTLSTRSYKNLVLEAQKLGYSVTVLYFWLDSPSLAIQRVKKRVENGGHNIPSDVIERRYRRGLENLFNIYIPICDRWLVFDNMDLIPEIIAQGDKFGEFVSNSEIWSTLKSKYHNER